ncbi:MAG: S8 family serine peptidase [Gemmatimonadota bacterium]
MSKTQRVVMLLACLLPLSACGGGGDGGNNPVGAVASVIISPGNQSVQLGGGVQYSAVAKDGNGHTVAGRTFTWASSNETFATISSSGLVTTIAAGITSISASTDGIAGSSQLTVTASSSAATIQGTVTLSGNYLTPPVPLHSKRAAPDVLPPLPQSSKSLAVSNAGTASRWVATRPFIDQVPNEWIVTFKPAAMASPAIGSVAYRSSATLARADGAIRGALAARASAGQLNIAGVSPTILAARVTIPAGVSSDAIAASLRADPSVLAVEPNRLMAHYGLERVGGSARAPQPAPPLIAPNDPLYQRQAWHYGMIDLERAWQTSTGSNTVVVAVIDNGIRFDHPGIAANLTNDGYDFVSQVPIAICAGGSTTSAGDNDGYDPDPTIPFDVNLDPNSGCITTLKSSGNHGMHVAGTIGATGNDGVGVTGVAWSVKIRPVRVLGIAGSGSNYDIAQGLLYAAGLPADNGNGGTVAPAFGAKIINMSLGGPSGATVLQNAVTAASNAGSLIIAAAGNDGTSTPNFPASYPEVVSVSAVGPDAILASYSTFGSTIDIAAPGGDVADGDGSFGVESTAWDFVNNMPIYDNQTWNGTSMASPHVAGVAALILAANPGLTAAQIRARLETYTIDLGAAGKDNQYGNGLVNARNALTQTNAVTGTIRVRLIASATGAVVSTVAAVNGVYQFTDVPNGTYVIYAGQDEGGDGSIGIRPRLWGAKGGTATPSTVTISGPGVTTADFTIGFPIEAESNNTIATADVLPVGGYLAGLLANPATDVDVSQVRIPTNGTYTFETHGLLGACGFALEEDTVLELMSSTGTVLATNDDINTNSDLLCSRITSVLAPGVYYLRVSAFNGQGAPGFLNRRYTVSARSGP